MISHPRKENNFLVFSTPLKKKKKSSVFFLETSMIGLQKEKKLRDGGCYLKQHNEPDKNKKNKKHRETKGA
jgi:hypothetical protein